MWCTTSTGIAMRSTAIAATGRPRGSTSTVDVSTSPSAPTPAIAVAAADCVPRLVPTSHTGRLRLRCVATRRPPSRRPRAPASGGIRRATARPGGRTAHRSPRPRRRAGRTARASARGSCRGPSRTLPSPVIASPPWPPANRIAAAFASGAGDVEEALRHARPRREVDDARRLRAAAQATSPAAAARRARSAPRGITRFRRPVRAGAVLVISQGREP